MLENWLASLNAILIANPVAAPVLYIGVHVLLAVFFLPCSPMTLIAGALWGSAYGLLVSMVAATASLAATFLLSRSFLRSRIEHFIMRRYPKVAGLLAQVAVHDWKIIAAFQLNPLIPASTAGYAFGLSRVTLVRYLVLSGIFMLPLQILYVVTGGSVTSVFTSDGHWAILLVSICLIAVVPFVGRRMYKKLWLTGVK